MPLEALLKVNLVVATLNGSSIADGITAENSKAWSPGPVCKELLWWGLGGLFMLKWFQWSGGSGMQSVLFYKDFRKQRYHVIPHMLPEPEILALLGADLLVKQI